MRMEQNHGPRGFLVQQSSVFTFFVVALEVAVLTYRTVEKNVENISDWRQKLQSVGPNANVVHMYCLFQVQILAQI